MQKLLIFFIHAYRLLAGAFPISHCRFYPSCSEYALTSVKRFGAMRGSWMAIRRLSRCHPWHAGGEDPVPQAKACHHG